MPHDISIFRTRYNEFKTEINDIQGNNKYPMLFVKLILLNGDIERYTTPDENGNLPKMNQLELNALATKYDELINELTSIANSTDTDPAAVQMRYTVNRYIDIIRNDAAVLKSTNLNNPMDINEILDAGMSSVFELPLDAELTDNSPISVEFDEDELTDGTFIRTGSNNLNTFFKATEVFGLQQMVQQVKPVTLTQGDDIFIGSFLQNTYGFKVGDATLQSPEIKYTVKNFENPTIFKDISDAQAMDYILGVKGRKNNVRLRFDENQPPTLTGFTLDATSDIFAEQPDLDINDLGVISQSFYNFISQQNEADFKNNLKNAGVTDAQATTAWTRLSQLKSKVDADIAFFQNTAPGFTAIRHIRIVQNNEWALHTANNLSATHQGSYFSVFSQIPASEKERVNKEAYRRPSENAPVKLEPVIATQPKAGIAPGDQETVKLSIPPLSNVKRVGNCLSSRYAISYKEGNVTKPGFFTPAKEYNYAQTVIDVFDHFVSKNFGYRDILNDIRDYYRTNADSLNIMLNATSYAHPIIEIPFKAMGYTREEARRFADDQQFTQVMRDLTAAIKDKVEFASDFRQAGFDYHQRIELKNVAMSEIADSLGVQGVVAKSYTMEVESGGHLTEGVFMENADGIDLQHLADNHPILKLNPDKLDDCFNNEEALKSIADLQILDFITLNKDRHQYNMIYKFDAIGTETPVFKGVIGIDNDYSFGTNVPMVNESHHQLPAINNMKVISEEMFEQLKNPDKVAELEAKMRQRGLKDEEVSTFRERIQMAINAVNDGHIRVVKKDEWAKGDNTFESLTAMGVADTSYFNRIKVEVVDHLKERAATYKEQLAAGVINDNYNPELHKTKFTPGKVVDSFGKHLENDKELRNLEKQTTEEMLSTTEADVAKLDATKHQKVTEISAVTNILQNANSMEYALGQADPIFQWSSGAYRDMKRAVKALKSFAQTIVNEKTAWDRRQQRNQENGLQVTPYKMSAENRTKMERLLNNVTDATAAYKARKRGQFEREHRLPKDVEYPRLSACDDVTRRADSLKTVFEASSLKSPMEYLHFKMNMVQGKLSAARSDEEFRNNLAEIIYYRILSETGVNTKKDSKMYTALTIGEVKKGKAKILSSKAFSNLMKMPKEELRLHAVAKNPKRLISYYKKELAKEKQKEVHKAKKAVPKAQPEANIKK